MKKYPFFVCLLMAMLSFSPLKISAGDYLRGDNNEDGFVSIADVTSLIDYLLSNEWPYNPLKPVVTTITANGVSFNMIEVKGGTFSMDHEANYMVTLSTFNIGETEVTRMLWYAVMGADPSEFKGDLTRPVEMVSWDDCQTFITKLNKLTGKHFRLPTEAEWVFAARGGNLSHGTPYAGGESVGDVAWYEGNSSATQPAATKAPNELGIYDMSGNVWEWCQDWYGDYPTGSYTNPQGPSTGTAKVFKGGSWHSPANNCTIGTRSHTAPENQVNHRGLRLAL